MIKPSRGFPSKGTPGFYFYIRLCTIIIIFTFKEYSKIIFQTCAFLNALHGESCAFQGISSGAFKGL